jgi:hypothetical protein
VACLLALTPLAGRAQSEGWQPGPAAVGDSTFEGFIDAPANGASIAAGQPIQVSGWIVDTTAQGWAGLDALHVYDGTADSGAYLGAGSVGVNRPDVAAALGNPYWAAAGFSAVIGPSALGPGQHTLTIYAHSPAKGWWYKQVTLTLVSAPASATSSGAQPVASITAPRMNEKVLTGSGTMAVEGFAFDPGALPNQGVSGSGVDKVHVVITDTLGSKIEGDADLGTEAPGAASYGPQFTNTGFRFAFRPTALHAGNAQIEVTAHSVVSGKDFDASSTFQVAEGSG